ncbi:amidohydrolase [Blastopirellula marina]|uniref:Amidohydrolase n=1 Tax=Blastopirellula marina TaxID=124 RepID=A0A2S8G194_9BACT|nr:amidohydrolase [Blastopirellula marina]PQO38217.1 amidohydrolase [Blastopirellula marina]PTL44873.1 amidohydrolase [Blastopirellula marina]
MHESRSIHRWKALLGILFWGLLLTPALGQQKADAVYLGGTVVTMDAEGTTAHAIATAGEKILAVGSNEEIRKLAGEGTVVHDLAGKTMLPGLYAAHDHFPGAGRVGLFLVDLNSPPIGKIKTMDELIAALKEQAKSVPPGTWIRGRGYDDTLLAEKRHPTREDLDKASIEHPIWIGHTSGHLGVANSLALKLANITSETKSPSGARIRKDEQTGEPNGVFEECGWLVTRKIPGRTQDQDLEAVKVAAQAYVRQGVTTSVIANGGTLTIGLLERALDEGIIQFRIVSMTSGGPYLNARASVEKRNSPLLRTGAIKMLQDGSIQGYTGYLSEPYYRSSDNRGYPNRSREALVEKVVELHKAGYQLAIHGNGDASIDDILFAYEEAQRVFPRNDTRHRIEHAQMMREDQIDKMKQLGVSPSYFAGHVYYWGDRHRDIFLGPERGARISPLASTVKRGIRFTMHDDTPVTPVDPLQLVWVAANRETTGGKILGPQQRISAERALRAVTADAAWQNFEETTKGSLEPGKLADMVILDQNPLEIDPGKIREIQVLETIVGGQSVFKLEEN